jgi:hypothetical protein
LVEERFSTFHAPVNLLHPYADPSGATNNSSSNLAIQKEECERPSESIVWQRWSIRDDNTLIDYFNTSSPNLPSPKLPDEPNRDRKSCKEECLMNEDCFAFRYKVSDAKDCWLYNRDIVAVSATMEPNNATDIHFIKCFTPQPRA